MVRLLLLSFVFFCLFTSDQSIQWDENQKLTWDNFLGEPNSKSDAAAVTSSGIVFGYKMSQVNNTIESITIQASAHFYPEKSWVKLNQANDHILGHEQLHFDITELFTRKLRQASHRVAPSENSSKTLDAIHARIVKDLHTMQDLYDNETDFSRNHENQALWEKKVKMELEQLKDYKE